MKRLSILALSLALVLGACSDKKESSTGPTPIEEETFAPELGVDLKRMTRTESGLYIEELTEGSGAVADPGKRVWVDYTGWLVDGREFDSSAGRGPFSFILGTRQVIQGWDEGVKGMKVGGTRRLVIPSDLAYGRRGSGEIPPYSTLVFEVTLAAVE